ncbi:FlgB family protein [Pseudooceanicola sp. MF1-13]|uniref:FlgB family protein n=1 Tax=Pseudooceanicola sp. MF1-13 TaxID=3379095 RepID=UPI003892A619
MFTSLDLFRTAHAMASHAGKRQAVIASNIANADTPGYRAKTVAAFTDVYQGGGPTGMRASRSGHLNATSGSARNIIPFTDTTAEVSPNGNSVSLEEEMLKGVEAQRQHQRAITIYRSGLTILRTSIGRR